MNEEMSKRKAEGIARMIGNPGVLSKGSTPWNKGVRGYMGGNRTSFTKETAKARAVESIGKPKKNKGCLVCLTEDKVVRKDPRDKSKSYAFRKRKSYARYVWERATGTAVPAGCVVWHIDGDYTNNDLANLEVISRSESCRRTLLLKRRD